MIMTASKSCGTAVSQHEYYQPTSLLTLTTEFVACNLIYVETFATVPDIIGESIFQAALRMDQFERKSPALCLKPFTLAYKQLVLETLQVNAENVLDTHLPEVKLFKHLRQLDLTGCGIDDYHEVIIHIGTELHLLEVLRLADNKLSDVGIQRLTAYSRVMVEAGLNNLAYLDLSGNQNITNRIFAYLKPFHRLATLKLTGCAIDTSQKESLLYSNMGFVASMPDPKNISAEVKCEGWAAPLINRWRSQRDVIQSSSSAAKFYSKKQDPSCTKREPDSQTTLVLVRQIGHPRFISDVLPASCPIVCASKNPPRLYNDNRDISQMSESERTVGRTINKQSLEGRHKRCHSSVSSEILLATYTKDVIETKKVTNSIMEKTQLDNVDNDCKLVKNQKRKNSHSGKSKRRKMKIVHTELNPSEEDPGDDASHKKCSSEETGRKDKKIQRGPSIFEYLD